MSKSTRKTEPMDPSVHRTRDEGINPNRKRECYAARTLVAEVHALFPEVPVEFSNYDGRNTALDVTFDLTVLLDASEADLATALLELVESDVRVDEVITTDGRHWPEGTDRAALVAFHSNLRTQDSREPFGLDDAVSILAETSEEESW